MKKWLFTLILLVTMLPSVASAHTGLEKSTPAAGETVTSTVSEITLEFEGKLEPLSTFIVKNQNGTVKPAQVNVDGAILRGSFATPLTDGDYEVQYKIVGADGHTIEKSYTFSIKTSGSAPSPSTVVSTAPDANVLPTDSPVVSQAPTAVPGPAPEPALKENNNRVTTIVTLIVIVVILILITLWLRRRRK
ncbi:copper resistance CopC family protein [Gorillibacterium massiliense]|uniref:copper resistance CopC family protein n=1 Tax=Gorillibacterium massiliense TaxID=1280390 RepID=UPI0004B4B925|nr:copper resistance CopC family protein [Gorillibacterium massiliense]